MNTIGMNLQDVLSPVTKKDFMKWHGEGALLLVGAGNQVLDILLSRINDYSIDWKLEGRQTTVATPQGKNSTVKMFSNGVDEFLLVIDDMQGSDYSKGIFKDTGRQHITLYVVA